ncbi:hypothetical protein FOL46_006191 [Perkinsus olseni]|uniref:C3H1-type domain-containing protein n=1 Tax=Perkinsus olseni TaxID=32597 RepID=A0A7J6LMG8_PEROL|nr:hypothetical protein FOL46_006191 [Perkinsus olseni]
MASDGNDPGRGASLVDLIIYWRRLADLLTPLTMDHLVQYDSDYRRRIAVMIAAAESTTLSDALTRDEITLAMAAMAAAAGAKKSNDSKAAKTQKKSNDLCHHFLRGNCRRGNSCRFVRDVQEQKRQRLANNTSHKDTPSSSEGNRKPKDTGPVRNTPRGRCAELREQEADTPAGYQDDTGISARLPSAKNTSDVKPAARDELRAYGIIDGIAQKWQLADNLRASLSPSGAIRDEFIVHIDNSFTGAADELRDSLSRAFPGYHTATASIGGPLYPDMIRLLSQLFDEGRDESLAEEVDRGISMGALTELSSSGVFPPKEQCKPKEEYPPCRNPLYKNYISARDAAQAVEETIQSELKAGKIRKLATHELHSPSRLYSKLATIPKRRDEKRNPNRLSAGGGPEEERQLAQRVIFDEAGTLKRYTGAVTDFEGAYRQLFICERERPLCSLRAGNCFYENLAMPFGAPSSCWNFCRLSSKSLRIQHRLAEISLGVAELADVSRGLIYIDDAIWLLPTEGYFPLLVKLLLILPLIGLKISWRKCLYGSQSLRFIGYTIELGTSPQFRVFFC